ncbi:MAG: dephospho-CoA kinase [Proteobacteria bacterium]|nr:dephospho-CoA kinase [Pseudomonadota bacterium]
MTRIVVLTGGIGSGKSTVGRMFEKLGARLIDADAVVHELQAPGSPVLDEIRAAFGDSVLDAEGALDRAALADRVFRDPEARQQLNAIVHPKVGVEIARRLQAARADGAPLVVLEIQLLFEVTPEGQSARDRYGAEAVVVAYAPRPVQLARAVARDGGDRADVERRLEAQLDIEEKRARADFVIDNSGSETETWKQVCSLYAEFSDSGEPSA